MLEFKTPVWLEDILYVTNGITEDNEPGLQEIVSKLQKAGYRANEKETEFLKKVLTCPGYHIRQNGVKPVEDKTEAITKLEVPKIVKELK